MRCISQNQMDRQGSRKSKRSKLYPFPWPQSITQCHGLIWWEIPHPFPQEESCAWVSPQTSHTGTLGEYGTGEGSKKERLEATSLFLTPGYISGPTLGRPGPSGHQRMRTLEMSGAPAPAGQAAQALTERRRWGEIGVALPFLSFLDSPYKTIDPPRPNHFLFKLSSHLELP